MAIQEALNEHIGQTGISQNAIARAIGVSASTLSQYLKNKYPGDVGALEGKIAQYLQISLERENYPRADWCFVRTSVAEQVFEIAANCHVGGSVGIVTGESGIGKTTAVREYQQQHGDVMVVYGRPSMTTRAVMREIAMLVGVDPVGAVDDVFMRIVKRLKGSQRMLIIDEAEHLTARVLDQIRRLSDPEFAGIGLLLVGLPRLLHMLRSAQGDHRYLYSRVGWSIGLRGLTDADCQAIVRSALPTASGLWRLYATESGKNARCLRNMIERSVEIAAINSCKIDADIVRETARVLIV